ncbi:hypothetical protein J5N97_018264 [Dioscorea zingiberensis]|uniref:RING-type domain-containing protein n=1 Tax=Dioscorea zingiberensis TaxID=325984 RepID=A0A9D5CNY4_9LILI|nr:hypothetical protein J5N97_018264 [Dioscorea zingiberensis]
MDQEEGGDGIHQQQQQQSPLPSMARDSLSGKIMLSAIAALFTAIIIVLFLHLYVRLHLHRSARRRRALLLASSSPSPPPPSAPRGLDLDLLRSLPVAVRSPSDDPIDCAVCLSEVEEGEKLRILPKCRHGFHVDCIDMWFFNHTTCPLCRAAVEAPLPEQLICDACSSSSGDAMVGIEEPPMRFDEPGFGFRFGSPVLRIETLKRLLSSDARSFSSFLTPLTLSINQTGHWFVFVPVLLCFRMDTVTGGEQSRRVGIPLRSKVTMMVAVAFTVAVLLTIFFHLYVRLYALGRRRRLQSFFRRPEPAGLDPEALKSIPVVAPSELEASMECAVCLSEIRDGEKARVLPLCRHVFHADCVDVWFFSHATCPLCRSIVAAASTAS